MNQETEKKIKYAFGHAVSSYTPDAHAGDSGELAQDILAELHFTRREKGIFNALAEEVAGNYRYTGEADQLVTSIERGEA